MWKWILHNWKRKAVNIVPPILLPSKFPLCLSLILFCSLSFSLSLSVLFLFSHCFAVSVTHTHPEIYRVRVNLVAGLRDVKEVRVLKGDLKIFRLHRYQNNFIIKCYCSNYFHKDNLDFCSSRLWTACSAHWAWALHLWKENYSSSCLKD